MVRPDNFLHDIMIFSDMRHADVLTQNQVQAGDLLIRSSNSMELVCLLSQVAVHWNEIISFDELG